MDIPRSTTPTAATAAAAAVAAAAEEKCVEEGAGGVPAVMVPTIVCYHALRSVEAFRYEGLLGAMYF